MWEAAHPTVRSPKILEAPPPDVTLNQRNEKLEGLTQSVVASRMGTKQANVSRLESGEVDVRRRTLRNYAPAIGVRIEYTVKDLDAAPAESPAKTSA